MNFIFALLNTIALVIVTTACSEQANFTGAPKAKNESQDSNGGAAAPSDSGGGPEQASDPGQSQAPASTDGNKGGCNAEEVKAAFPAPVQECFDSNRIWDFARSTCTEAIGSGFECTYDGLFGALSAQDLAKPAKMTEAQEKGAKLIACGEKNDGKTIVAQWVYLPQATENSCNYDVTQGLPVTGCYRKMKDPPTLETKEEIAAFVAQCLDQ